MAYLILFCKPWAKTDGWIFGQMFIPMRMEQKVTWPQRDL